MLLHFDCDVSTLSHFSISEYYEYGHGTGDESYNNYGKERSFCTQLNIPDPNMGHKHFNKHPWTSFKFQKHLGHTISAAAALIFKICLTVEKQRTERSLVVPDHF